MTNHCNRIRATILWLGTWSLNFLITGAKHTYLQLLVEARLELTLLLIKPSLLSCVNKVALFLCKLVFFLHNFLQKRKKVCIKTRSPPASLSQKARVPSAQVWNGLLMTIAAIVMNKVLTLYVSITVASGWHWFVTLWQIQLFILSYTYMDQLWTGPCKMIPGRTWRMICMLIVWKDKISLFSKQQACVCLQCTSGVTAEYPSNGSYNPEKASYMDTQLSPANALRTRNTYVILALCLLSGYAAMQLWRPPLPIGIC